MPVSGLTLLWMLSCLCCAVMLYEGIGGWYVRRRKRQQAGKRDGNEFARCRHGLEETSSFLFPDVPVLSLQLFRLPKPGSSLDHEDEIGEYDYNNPNDTSNFCPAAQVTGSKNISLLPTFDVW